MKPKESKVVDELRDEVAELTGLLERIRRDKEGMALHIKHLQGLLEEALHNKARLECQLRARIADLGSRCEMHENLPWSEKGGA